MLVTSFNELRRWVVANDHSFPEDMMSFIDDHEVKDFLSSYMIANPAFILDEFIDALQNYVSGEVRNPVEIARSMILNRSIVHENDSPAKYAQRFQQCSRLLPDESQSSLCQHYLAGLHPSLRQRCALDRMGTPGTRCRLSSSVRMLRTYDCHTSLTDVSLKIVSSRDSPLTSRRRE